MKFSDLKVGDLFVDYNNFGSIQRKIKKGTASCCDNCDCEYLTGEHKGSCGLGEPGEEVEKIPYPKAKTLPKKDTVRVLEGQVRSLKAEIVHLKECLEHICVIAGPEISG